MIGSSAVISNQGSSNRCKKMQNTKIGTDLVKIQKKGIASMDFWKWYFLNYQHDHFISFSKFWLGENLHLRHLWPGENGRFTDSRFPRRRDIWYNKISLTCKNGEFIWHYCFAIKITRVNGGISCCDIRNDDVWLVQLHIGFYDFFFEDDNRSTSLPKQYFVSCRSFLFAFHLYWSR